MKPTALPLDQLREDPLNARVHPERNLAAIEASLRRFGQQKPIVVAKDGTVVAGNGTLAAARRLGWDSLLCVRTDLPPDEARAFAIADNRTAELAEWDMEVLASSAEEVCGEMFETLAMEEIIQMQSGKTTGSEYFDATSLQDAQDAAGLGLSFVIMIAVKEPELMEQLITKLSGGNRIFHPDATKRICTLSGEEVAEVILD